MHQLYNHQLVAKLLYVMALLNITIALTLYLCHGKKWDTFNF